MKSSVIESAYYLKGSRDLAAHSHTSYEIIYVEQGCIDISIGDKNYIADAPALIFLSRLESHSVSVRSGEYKRYFLCLSPSALEKRIKSYTLLSVLSSRPRDFVHVLNVGEIKDDVERIFSRIITEFNGSSPFHEDLEALLVNELLVLIYRMKPSLFSVDNSKSISIVWQIQRKFEEEPQAEFSLDELAEKHHISKYYLSRLFKKNTGYSPMQYLMMCRLATARNLLEETDKSISEVVWRSGFSDGSNFSRYFKARTGMSPEEYRKSRRASK